MSFLKDLIETVLPVAYAEEAAEEPAEEETQDSEGSEDGDAEETGDSTDGDSEDGDEEGEDEDDDDDDDEDDEDEDEEETVDPLDALREECAKSPACHPYVHHYEECVERVTKAQEDPDYEHQEHKEDCVEEFFHLQHSINDCVAPKLFYKLK